MNIRPNTFQKNSLGQAEVGGVSVASLVEMYGTPLYVMDEKTIRDNCQLYTSVLKQSETPYQVLYAGKANLSVGLVNIIASEGLGLDVVSGGELYTALQSRLDPTLIYFHGNNKSRSELELAISHHVTIVLDNRHELEMIKQVSETLEKTAKIMIRLKPEIEAHTHEYIKTGQIDSKFGIEKERMFDLINDIQSHDRLDFVGLHSHIGSQIFEDRPYFELVEVMTDHLFQIKKHCHVDVRELNLGGGLGIPYTTEDHPLDISRFMKQFTDQVVKACASKSVTCPKLLFEPGRSIVGTAGMTLYSIGIIKEIPDIRTYLFIDGGMADNPRPIMYKSEYTFDVLNSEKDIACYSIAGKFCESGDILAKDVELPRAKVGDTLVVFGTGAYNYVMSSNYNRSRRPAMVSVFKGESRLLVKRETYDDLIAHDVY